MRAFTRFLVLGLIFAVLAPAGAGADLGTARLQIAGTRLVVSPESQTVPFDTPTVVETTLEGFDPTAGVLVGEIRVLAELRGPEIDGFLTLEARPGEPFRIPRLNMRGEYRLEDIRLVAGDELLAYATPREAAILVTQVLVTRVSSRPLTLDEIRHYGILVDDDNFQAFNFSFGFGVAGQTVDFNVPAIFQKVNGKDQIRLVDEGGWRDDPSRPRPHFQPPRLLPFTLEAVEPARDNSGGGCLDPFGDCTKDAIVPLPGAIIFPSDVRLLNQFFSVVLLVQNGAPENDVLRLRDLVARLSLPPGLRLAETEPPTYLGTPLPIRVPGPDGRLGTADDLTFLVAQAQGQAEALVEGLSEGTHLVKFEIDGVLEGLPTGPRPVSGTAKGAVLVRDPNLGITISHPQVVRTDEEYSLLLTVTNTSLAPANLVTVALDPAGLSGVVPVGPISATIPSLLPGDAELIEFRMRSQRTGRVIASAARVGGGATPRFELRAGVGENDIPLSPATLILPRVTENLPPDLVRQALNLIGLGYSLAHAATLETRPDLPQVDQAMVEERMLDLTLAGRYVGLGEDLFDALAALTAEWLGNRDRFFEWDRLRRTTQKGAAFSAALGARLSAEANSTSPAQAFERFVAATAALPAFEAVLASGDNVQLELSSRLSGSKVSGVGLELARVRDLPFGDVFAFGAGQLAIAAVPEDLGYRATVRRPGGGAVLLKLLLVESDGSRLLFDLPSFTLGPNGRAWIEFADETFEPTLVIDADGDGEAETQLVGSSRPLPSAPFAAVAAVPNTERDPTGHLVDVLFSADVDAAALFPPDPQRFRVPSRVSNGGALESAQATTLAGRHRPTRVVRVAFDNPLSPYVVQQLTVADVRSVRGDLIFQQTLAISAMPDPMPGGLVEGRVFGADGQPVPNAPVELYEFDYCETCLEDLCVRHKTAAVLTDAGGNFSFDYVRQTRCGNIFELEARDPRFDHRLKARNAVNFIGQTVDMELRMRARGLVRGQVRYDDGSVPALSGLEIIGHNAAAAEGRRALIEANGSYQVGDLPVGTITLSAHDGRGQATFATVALGAGGAEVIQDLVIPRRPAGPAPGALRGLVVRADDGRPVAGAYLALYFGRQLSRVERSDENGRFDFGHVAAGIGELEAYDGESGLNGARLFFEIASDRQLEVEVRLRDERGTVTGRVLQRSATGVQTPIAEAPVWIEGTPFNTRSDANGFYRLDGVFAGESRRVRAALPNDSGRQAFADVTIIGGAVANVDVVFVEALEGGISGFFLNENGQPIPMATVHLEQTPFTWYRTARTDASGRFLLPDLAPGRYVVHATSGSLGAKGSAEIRFPGDTPSLTLQVRKGRVSGQVKANLGNGQTIGVSALLTYRTTTVRYELVGLDNIERTLETEADGTFELPETLVGSYIFTVHNAYHGTRTVRNELIFHGQAEEHEVLFETTGEIRGRVFQHDGVTPAVGATVKLRHPSFANFDVTTDSDGRFRFALVPPSNTRFPIEALWSEGPTFRQAQIWVQLAQSNQELDVEMILPQQSAVVGWVHNANEQPVPGAIVTLREHDYPHRILTANSDSEGNFSFSNVFAGPITVTAQAPQLGGLGGSETLPTAGEGQEHFLVIELQATGEIEGVVLSPVNGQPVAGVEVQLFKLNSQIDRTTSDAAGRFRFRLLKLATYSARAFDPSSGRSGQVVGLQVGANNQVVATTLTLEARGDVVGHLFEPGTPAVGVPAATIELQTRGLQRFRTFSSSNGEGHFTFLGIPEGEFDLKANEPGGRRKSQAQGAITAEGQEVTVDLVLEAVGRVVGTVLAPPGAPAGPFSPVNVRISQDSQVIGASLESAYDFSGVIAGRSFSLDADQIGGAHRGRKSGAVTSHGQALALDVQMVALGNVSIRVADSFGNPVPNANVRLSAHGFYGQKNYSGSSGGDNELTFTNVGAGSLSAFASDPVTGLSGSVQGSLSLDGATVNLDVRLESSGQVLGLVRRANLEPAVNALIALTINSRTLYAFTADDGRFAFPAAPMGAVVVFAQEPLGLGQRTVRGTLSTNGQILDFGEIVLDELDPQVAAISPAEGLTDLPVTTAPTIEFSEPLDTARMLSNWIELRRVEGSGVAVTRSWLNGGRTLRLTPNGPLQSFTRYEVVVWTLLDVAGRKINVGVRSSFSTADVVPPTVIDVLPRALATEVALSAQPRLTFSEKVQETSLGGTNLQLRDLTNNVNLTTTFLLTAGDREVQLTPVDGLVAERLYELRAANVLDLSGNPMAAPFVTTFRTVDTTAPRVLRVTPALGQTFTSGETMALKVDVIDSFGVVDVVFSVGDRTATDTSSPYQATLPAPTVSAEQDVMIFARARDAAGNVGEAVWPVRVAPNSNPGVPQVKLASCHRSGDLLAPGVAQPIAFTIVDDSGIDSYSFVVDGSVVETRTANGTPTIASSFSFIAPAGDLPGRVYSFEVRAADFAGNSGAALITMAVAPASVRVGNVNLSSSLHNGQALILAGGTFSVQNALHLPSLILLAGAKVVPRAGEMLDLKVDGVLRVQCNAALDGSGLGYAGEYILNGYRYGQTGLRPGAAGEVGGSHGGTGASIGTLWNLQKGVVFDSVLRPQMGGGAGGPAGPNSGATGGAGGSAIRIRAEELQLDGSLISRGLTAGQVEYRTGGAGGAVWLETDRLSGAGIIDVQGGDALGCYAFGGGGGHAVVGSGGGGRVGLYTEFDGFALEKQVNAAGGSFSVCGPIPAGSGGAGTIYVARPGAIYGDLIVDPGRDANGMPKIGPTTVLPDLPAAALTGLVTEAGDAWVSTAALFTQSWIGAWMVLLDGTGQELGAFQVQERDATGRLKLAGAAGVVGASSCRGEYRFDRLELAAGIRFDSPVPVVVDDVELKGQNGSVSAVNNVRANNLTVREGATLVPVSGSEIKLQATGRLEIAAGAKIDVSGRGYSGTYTVSGNSYGLSAPNVTGSRAYPGGSHGGSSVFTFALYPPGEIFDSVYSPTLPGAAGSQNFNLNGGAGGGVIWLAAGELVLDGQLLAGGFQGAGTNHRTGGAGGTVAIEAQSLRGLGRIDLRGGPGTGCANSPPSQNFYLSGSGGGGRAALRVQDLGSFDLGSQVDLEGGAHVACGPVAAGNSGSGTAFVFHAGSIYGELFVEGGSAAITELPKLGTGTIATVTPTGADATITAVDTAFRFDLGVVGMWARIQGVDYRVEAQAGDRKAITLEGAAGVVQVGQSFEGIYKFDRVTLRGGAKVGLRDLDVITTVDAPAGTRLWRRDRVAPTLGTVLPAAGSAFLSGSTIAASAIASDDVAMGSVTFILNGQSVVDATAPYEASLTAPSPLTSTVYPLRIEAHDAAGNPTVVEHNLTISPNGDLLAPQVVLGACPQPEDRYAPGAVVSVPLTASDDIGVVSYSLLVDGVVVSSVTGTNSTNVAATLSWTPPASYVPGAATELRVEARDAFGNVGVAARTLRAPSGIALSGNLTLDPAALAGLNVTLGGGVFTLASPLSVAELTLAQGAHLTAPVGVALDLTVVGDLRVQCGGKIDLVGKGYLGGHFGHPDGYGPAGFTVSRPDAGGSHGGIGIVGDGTMTAGAIFGSIAVPTQGGGGGAQNSTSTANSYISGAGGGALWLEAGRVLLEGQILASGNTGVGTGHSGGAGGSILIKTPHLLGNGTLDATGGTTTFDGAGGGGRIALYVDDLSGFDLATKVNVLGGTYRVGANLLRAFAGTGTLFIKRPGQELGELWLSNPIDATYKPPISRLPTLGSGNVVSLTAEGEDAWLTAATAQREVWLGAWVHLRDVNGATIGRFRVADLDGSGRLRLVGAAAAAGTATTYAGEHRFDKLILRGSVALADTDPIWAGKTEVYDEAKLPARLSGHDLEIRGAAITSSEGNSFTANLSGRLLIPTGMGLTLNGRGYTGGTAPPGVQASTPDAGGSHGGEGLLYDGTGSPGAVFDSVYKPHWAGGGGAHSTSTTQNLHFAGTGGGVFQITAATVEVDGSIQAKGANGITPSSSGGAGGTIAIKAGTLRGSGLLNASGASVSLSDGSGGGGRIALEVDVLAGGFDPLIQATAAGGTVNSGTTVLRIAGTGTIFLKTAGQTYGDLILTQPGTDPNLPIGRTLLPALGSGAIVAWQVAGADAWLTAAQAFTPPWLGVWVELEDAQNASLSAFRVAAIDSNGRIRLEGAGSVADAAKYRGEYRFDRLIQRGGRLIAVDPLRFDLVEAGGIAKLPPQLRAREMVVKAGAIVGLAQAQVLDLELEGDLTIEATGRLDLTGMGYAGGRGAYPTYYPNGKAPAGLQEATPDFGGSHGGRGVKFDGPGTLVGAIYDSVYAPSLGGGGGASSYSGGGLGGSGGGVALISVDELNLHGDLRARGGIGEQTSNSGGAGGTIVISARQLRGSGFLDAAGGDSFNPCSSCGTDGPGGGGRIAIVVDELVGFEPELQAIARGGIRKTGSTTWAYAAAGTVFVKLPYLPLGKLIVDNGATGTLTVPITELPAIGSGIVGTVEADQSLDGSYWITPESPTATFGLGVVGMWARVNGSDYRVLEQSADRRRVRLANAASVAAGHAYSGVYKFDLVRLKGRAQLRFVETAELGGQQIDAGAAIVP